MTKQDSQEMTQEEIDLLHQAFMTGDNSALNADKDRNALAVAKKKVARDVYYMGF